MDNLKDRQESSQERIVWQGKANLLGFILPNLFSILVTGLWAFVFLHVNSNILNRGLMESSAIQFFGLSPLVISVGLFSKKCFDFFSTQITVTDKKIVLKKGRKSEEIQLNHIKRAEVTISPFDEIFGSGSITILQNADDAEETTAIRTIYAISRPDRFLLALGE